METTHNQSPVFADVHIWQNNLPLREAIGSHCDPRGLDALGAHLGAGTTLALGRAANEWPPRHHPVDEKGGRTDIVEFHPAYHELMRQGVGQGLHDATVKGWAVERGARFMMTAMVECGHLCPLTMTHASLACLSTTPEVAAEWAPGITTRTYDPRPIAPLEKAGLTIGMGMTERMGGSDLGGIATTAVPQGNGIYSLSGAKWFLSAPMSDGFVILARASGGLTAFLVPRLRPDGSLNGLRLDRLKPKLGNRSNASAELVLDGARGHRLAAEGDGLRALLPMVNLTRLDCALASTGLVRLGLMVALHHARNRRAFGRLLADQPVMRSVLAEMALVCEAMTALSMRLCIARDAADTDPAAAFIIRLVTPVAKFWICKLAPAVLYEAMECLGGNGYIEDGPMARAYREAPVNAIWEGSGNVIALDVMRVLRQEPSATARLLDSWADTLGDHGPLLERLDRTRALIAGGDEEAARRIAEGLAIAAAGSAMSGAGDGAVAAAFARWQSEPGPILMRGLTGSDMDILLARAWA